MIMRYNFMVDTNTGGLPSKFSLTLYRDNRLLWLSTMNHHAGCAWIRTERAHMERAMRTIKPAVRPPNEYRFRVEMVQRAVDDFGAPSPALGVFDSGHFVHLTFCERFWSANDSA